MGCTNTWYGIAKNLSLSLYEGPARFGRPVEGSGQLEGGDDELRLASRRQRPGAERVHTPFVLTIVLIK